MSQENSQNNGNGNGNQPRPKKIFPNPIEDDFDLGSDMDTDIDDDDEVRFIRPPIRPFNNDVIDDERDPSYLFILEVLTGIPRLTPAQREVARATIRSIFERIVFPEMNLDPQLPPRPVPRYSPHG